LAPKKKTLPRMPPLTRRLAKLLGELDSTRRKLKTLIPQIQSAELEAEAFMIASKVKKGQKLDASQNSVESSMLNKVAKDLTF